MTYLAYTTVTNNGLIVPSPNSFDFDFDKEETLARRHRKKRFLGENLVFEFTKDPGLLHQYYKIRAHEFIDVLGLTSNYPDTETQDDRNGQILVARKGNFCVGGVRLTGKTPHKSKLLPMEIKDFRLEKHFPHLRHKQLSYGQISNLSLLPEFRYGDITREIIKRVFSRAVAMNLSILFAASPIANSRLYKQYCISMGWKGTELHYDIELPYYPYLEEVKLYLMSIEQHLTPVIAEPATSTRNHHLTEV